jgi:hypothetical protein
MNADGTCPACSTAVQPSTLHRYDGICRRCFNEPRNERYYFIVFAAFALLAIVAAFLLDAEIRSAAATGATIRLHWAIAAIYNGLGLLGVRILFALLFGLPLLMSLRSLVRWRRLRQRNSQPMASSDDG